MPTTGTKMQIKHWIYAKAFDFQKIVFQVFQLLDFHIPKAYIAKGVLLTFNAVLPSRQRFYSAHTLLSSLSAQISLKKSSFCKHWTWRFWWNVQYQHSASFPPFSPYLPLSSISVSLTLFPSWSHISLHRPSLISPSAPPWGPMQRENAAINLGIQTNGAHEF